ncbi:MAG: transcription-repair coupling factor [Phycisphaerales bacterium]|nr:transcription-repair coupling factor [Phycisphaerales bacterium]
MDIIRELSSGAVVRAMAEALGKGRRIVARGSQGSSGSFVAAALGSAAERPVLLVTAHLDDADEAVDELSSAGVEAMRLPALEVLPGESAVSMDLFAERLAVIRRLAAGGWGGVLVSPIQALMQPAPGPDRIAALAMTLRTGEKRSLSEVVRWLEAAGYTRLDAIEEAGDFAVRGGIVDVFPQGAGASRGGASPVRLDYFGDELERISEIDMETMGSDRRLESVEILCASMEAAFVGAPSAKSEGGKANGKRGGVEPTIDALGGQAERGVSMLEYAPRESVVVLHETMELVEQARGYFERITDPRIYGPPAVLRAIEERFGAAKSGGGIVELNQFSAAMSGSDAVVDVPVEPLPALAEDAGEAVKELAAMAGGAAGELESLSGPARVAIFCQNEGERSRLRELIAEFAPGAASLIEAHVRYVHRGFVWREAGGDEDKKASKDQGIKASTLLVVPYHELLHRFERRRAGARKGEATRLKTGRAIDTFLDFSPGDFVVHREHGIARFLGLTVMKPREVKKTEKVVLPSERPKEKGRGPRAAVDDPDAGLEEYLILEFAGQSKLYVPAAKIDQIQKYVGGMGGKAGEKGPTLSALGGQRWKKQKESVAESVKDLAGELLRVRAAREHLPGTRYPADTAWQREFEAEFPYQETDDQLAALAEIKRDMTSGRPMDRLLCGDVGYGKTELAIRAAFKACEFGKQVAVLVPTTVLAEQHERTFKGRFADYPFKVESLSRFKTDKEINQTLEKVRKGQVDVVIGTHRLLSKDVKFSDLGLVVVDEEQRFGVEHKERLLSLRMTVDVLTLSATPIPRTLHLSMLGLRDISSLATAPVDRRAVVTEVIPYNARRIQQAIARELARDGQCYFVHNRVYNIVSIADNIQKLAPEARIVVGHGQMPDGELESVMLRFMRREADILVSTTIIESGIDISSANTMFINDADRFGLADLHQLRGRVGRYKHRAYCYMLLDPERTTTEKALKRLKAIEEFSMLGAGFKIAVRDLEIRGAGNILGPEQSGHIAAVGYEMYCQLLDRAVKELKNEPTQVASETSVEIGVTGMIPKRYIASDLRRMEAYRRIATAQSPSELDRIENEIKQAYGADLPASTQRLLAMAELRALASALRVRSIAVRGQDVVLRAAPEGAAVAGVLLRDQSTRNAAEAGGSHVTVLDPKSGEDLSEVYFRPPASWMVPETLLGVLRRRLNTAEREGAAAGAAAS